MRYDFDELPRREGTNCYKYDMRREVFGRPDVVPMWIADMDFEVGDFITDAIKNRAGHELYGYDFHAEEFFRSVTEWTLRRNGWNIERDWLVFTPGVVAGFVCAELAFTREGEGIVIQPPVYPPFAGTIRDNNRKLIGNPLKQDGNGYEIDFDDLDRKLAGAKALLFCNPHNPVGRVYTERELRRVGELCIKHGVLIFSDEIHSDLVYKPTKFVHISSLSEEIASRTITFLAPSKTFNLAGMATSVAVIPDRRLRDKFRAQIDKLHIGMGNTFGDIAFRAAYGNGDLWLDRLLDYLAGNISYVTDFLKANIPSVKCARTEGTYLMWLDFRALGLSGDKLRDFLVNGARLGLSDGRQFGTEGDGFARMNVATSHAIVRQALFQLQEAVGKLKR